MKNVTIYTDGSCLGNPGQGAYAAVLSHTREDGSVLRRELVAGYSHTTNNRMEILGVVKALECLRAPCTVDLYTDSQYVAKAIKDGWLRNWEKNGWKTAAKKPVKNRDLWEQMSPLLKKHQVTFHWLKGHAGHPENERCDELARTEAAKKNLPPDTGFQE